MKIKIKLTEEQVASVFIYWCYLTNKLRLNTDKYN